RSRPSWRGCSAPPGGAAPLLHAPGPLFRDDPANGLDPAGIVEMRDLLRQQAASGKTVFISSHVMAEVQQICDRVAIINLGELVRVALVADLLAGHGEVVVKVGDPPPPLALIQGPEWGPPRRVGDGGGWCPRAHAVRGRGGDLARRAAPAAAEPRRDLPQSDREQRRRSQLNAVVKPTAEPAPASFQRPPSPGFAGYSPDVAGERPHRPTAEPAPASCQRPPSPGSAGYSPDVAGERPHRPTAGPAPASFQPPPSPDRAGARPQPPT